MPDGRSGNYNGLVQGGSNADNVLADAYVKGLGRNTDDPAMAINWTAGYQAMLKDAEVQPYNTFSPLDQTGSVKEGRGSLYDWIPLGYVSSDRSTRPVSKTVEYSLNDYALSVVAGGEGTPGDVEKYLNRSAGWQNLWNADIQHAGFTGFLAPKNSSGAWDSPETYSPAVCGGCEWGDISYEAVPFEYSFVVPHDMETLVQFMGGQTEFERRLDYIVSCQISKPPGKSCASQESDRIALPQVHAEYIRAEPQREWCRHHYYNEHRVRIIASRACLLISVLYLSLMNPATSLTLQRRTYTTTSTNSTSLSISPALWPTNSSMMLCTVCQATAMPAP